MRTRASLIVLSLLVAACGPGAEVTTTTQTTTTTTTATTLPPTTTTTVPPPTGEFALSTITFGEGQMVLITNVGDEAGSLAGYFLCQRPAYFALPDVEVPPGGSVAVSTGGSGFTPPPGAIVVEEVATIGSLSPTGGEVALYSAPAFSSSEAIVSYVEWGSGGHGRSSFAVEAGIWSDGGFVATNDETTALVADTLPATSPEDWSTG